MLFENWTIVRNYEKVDAPVSVCGGAVKADLKPGQYSLARVVGRTEGYRGHADWRMTFASQCGRGVKRQVFYNWLDADGKTLFMGHGAPEIEFTSPVGAVSLEVTVCFLGYDGGHGELSGMRVLYAIECTQEMNYSRNSSGLIKRTIVFVLGTLLLAFVICWRPPVPW